MSIRSMVRRLGADDVKSGSRRHVAARMTGVLASLCGAALLLSACSPRNAAVGDTTGHSGNGSVVVHDSIDKGDVSVGLIGSDDAALDRTVLAALSGSGLNVSYVSTSQVRNPFDAAQQGVKDLAAQPVSVILITRIDADTAADAHSWDEALGAVRNAGIPVALINPRTPPRDATLCAAQLNTAGDIGEGTAKNNHENDHDDKSKTAPIKTVPIAQAVMALVNDVPHGRMITVNTAAQTTANTVGQ